MKPSDLNEHTIPPGGWQFFQPQTGWNAPSPVAFTFSQQVVNIIKMRKANPAITAKHKLATDRATVAAELMGYTQKRLGMSAPEPPKFLPPRMLAPVAGGVAALKKLASGAATLFEWEESGLPPVLAELAASRAAICAGCSRNSDKAFSEIFTAPVSEGIRARLSRIHQMNLTTPSDEGLHVCGACLCPLKLKVHTPFSLIEKRLKPENRAELDPKCWILSEAVSNPGK